jgi:hypothetical protein
MIYKLKTHFISCADISISSIHVGMTESVRSPAPLAPVRGLHICPDVLGENVGDRMFTHDMPGHVMQSCNFTTYAKASERSIMNYCILALRTFSTKTSKDVHTRIVLLGESIYQQVHVYMCLI